jgi:hypothetical protein
VVRGRLRRVHTVGLALQGDSRHRDLGLRRQTLLDGFHRRVAGRIAVTMAIGLDRYRDEIRVVELFITLLCRPAVAWPPWLGKK